MLAVVAGPIQTTPRKRKPLDYEELLGAAGGMNRIGLPCVGAREPQIAPRAGGGDALGKLARLAPATMTGFTALYRQPR